MTSDDGNQQMVIDDVNNAVATMTSDDGNQQMVVATMTSDDGNQQMVVDDGTLINRSRC